MDPFKRNLYIGYFISLLILVGSAIASYVSIRGLLNSAAAVNHTNKIARNLEMVLSTLKDAETGQRGFLLTKDDRFLAPYNGAPEKVALYIGEVSTLTIDNDSQQVDIRQLKEIATSRINYLAYLIKKKRSGEIVSDSLLLNGKQLMNEARELVRVMQDREERLLTLSTHSLQRFAAFTPVLLLVASILAIFITILSLLRVVKDYNSRLALQGVLQKKEAEIAARLTIIENISMQVAAGNYKVKVNDEGKDALGGIAVSLNKMAESLDNSFTALASREWLQTGMAGLNEIVIVEKDIAAMTEEVLSFLVEYTGSQAGAFYVFNKEGKLELKSGFALTSLHQRRTLEIGEGLAGQAAKAGKIMQATDLSPSDYRLSYVSGEITPKAVIAIPLIFNTKVKGVIELASMQAYSDNVMALLKSASFNTGIIINTAINRQRVQELLEETQSQAEELQLQHSELENINAELEAQAEKLQASEEELRVQQEELQQANSELEERSRLLEEKNELILERNLQIQRKAEELGQSTRYKSEFLANMSHELRTPLNSILLLSRLMSENHSHNLTADQVEYANVIQTSGNGLLTLIDEILDLSKIEAGKMELETTEVNPAVVAKDLQQLFAPIAKDKGIGFSINVAEGTGSFPTDRLRLEQVLRNLISNALKFTKKGSVQVRIAQENALVYFAVKDTGIGIPRDKQQTIFEAFQQADGSTRRQFGGTGLGLSISRELARLLGGEIKLQSEVGEGSEFTLYLPLIKQVEMMPLAITEQSYTPVPEQKMPVLPVANQYLSEAIPLPVPDDCHNVMPGDKVILIIEDDTPFARSLLDYTRQKGYRGIVAVRGDEGIALAQQFLPLGILLDLQLPVKSGWEVMDELKANAATRHIPVHIMSSQEAKKQSLLKGAVDFINKPVAFEKLGEMFSKIEAALSIHPKKVMIVEENAKHAQALSYFLQQYQVGSEIKNSVSECITALQQKEVDCVILDMGVPAQTACETLEEVKKTPGLEHVPIIIFTGSNLSHSEEVKIKQYAETIVVKTAHSYQRILDEVSLFLHLVEENKKEGKVGRYKKMGELGEVLKGKTILVADDDVRNIFSLTRSLEKYGMNVVSAIDGKEALQQLDKPLKIDLVLMDMMMPEMDGYESTRRIRQLPAYRNLPVIAVTAKAMTGDREKCIEAGASDYITKPVDIDQLISLLRVWLYQ